MFDWGSNFELKAQSSLGIPKLSKRKGKKKENKKTKKQKIHVSLCVFARTYFALPLLVLLFVYFESEIMFNICKQHICSNFNQLNVEAQLAYHLICFNASSIIYFCLG